MKVIVYEPHYNDKHRTVLRAFAEGIPGATVKDVREYEPCDIAVIFGLVKKSYEPTWSKGEILKRHSGRSLIVVESAFVKRGEYWAIGWGGIHGDADFRNDHMPTDRWPSFGVDARPWSQRKTGPVLVCGQLPRDTNVQDTDHCKWCRETVAYYAERRIPVQFRPHPRIDDPDVYGVDESLFDTNKRIQSTLKGARCVVVYNSTSGVDAAIHGVPVIACAESAMCGPVASRSLDLADLRTPSRDAWLAGLGYAQWSLGDMREGLPWRHLTRP